MSSTKRKARRQLLLALRAGPDYGARLQDRLELYRAPVYEILRELEEQGLAMSALEMRRPGKHGAPRRYYQLTERGMVAADNIARQHAAGRRPQEAAS